MTDWQARQSRYQRDNVAIQLGGLASNLGRIAWCAERDARQQTAPIFRESKYFTDWAASSCSLEQQILLAALQRELSSWERGWGTRHDLSRVTLEAKAWSRRLLEAAGLLPR